MSPGRFFHLADDGRAVCDLCPRRCALRPGQRGFCFVRQGTADGIALTTYGRSSGFCIDPIEKKPLNHFYPGTSVLSFGTAGCNLGCKFCQNWNISKARHMDQLQARQGPDDIAALAAAHDCTSVAFTYNDPVIFAEYAIDTAAACRARGIHPVAVSAGYITAEARTEFFAAMDAVNIDLKAFTQDFYRHLCLGDLEPVKDTLRYLVHETDVWTEITTLLIPGQNDDEAELHQLCTFVAEELSGEVPLHFSAFHPDFRMGDTPATPVSTLRRARAIAHEHGLRHVYLGNVHDHDGDTTTCAGCGEVLIERDWYNILSHRLDDGACPSCGQRLAGRFSARAGTFGRRRVPLRVL